MHLRWGWALCALASAGCYTGARATADVNAAWRGRSRAALEADWGTPASEQGRALAWTHTRHEIGRLPSAEAELRVGPDRVDGRLELSAGELWERTTTVIARLDDAERVLEVQGPSLRWGPPGDANLRWGTVLGLHAGMGRLDDTSTPLPSGGLYIGGMLGPRLGLVGTVSLAAGTGDEGGAMGLAAGMAAQWWPARRVWLRGGPVALLAWEPGFHDPGIGPGLGGGAGYALVDTGHFVLDVRVDLVAGLDVAFGSVGVGVNLQ